MHRNRLGLAAASVTACALFGSLGSAQTAVAGEVGPSATEAVTAAATTTATVPFRPQHEGPRRHRGGDSVVIGVDEGAKRSQASSLARVVGATRDANDSVNPRACRAIAVEHVLSLRASLMERQAARAPPAM